MTDEKIKSVNLAYNMYYVSTFRLCVNVNVFWFMSPTVYMTINVRVIHEYSRTGQNCEKFCQHLT